MSNLVFIIPIHEDINFYELHAPTTHGIAATVFGFIAVLVLVYLFYRYYAGSSRSERGGCLKRRYRTRPVGAARTRAYDENLVMAVHDYQQHRMGNANMPDVQAFRQHFQGPELADVLSRDLERQMPGLSSSSDSKLGDREKF